MAEYDSRVEGGAVASAPLATMTHVTAAAVSVALIAGVGVWGYELMVRDVSGIPVVRAAEGEMRVRPEDPGGQLAQHQGLAVNQIAARGYAAGPVEQVILAPPEVVLTPEDQPTMDARGIIQDATAGVPVGLSSETLPSVPVLATEARQGDGASVPESSGQEAIDDIVAELMGETPEHSPSAARVDVEGTKTVEARVLTSDISPQPAVLTALPENAVATSIRPKLRPQNAAFLVKQVPVTQAAVTNEVDAAAIPSGTRLAQLGAYESAEVARSEWERMQNRFGDILLGKSRVVQRAESGGRTFYRLRAMGFVDLADARRFCSAVKAEGVDCIPVQVR